MTITQLLQLHTNNLPDTHSVKQSKNFIEIFDEHGNNLLYAHIDGRIYSKEFKLINSTFKETSVAGFKIDKRTGNLAPFKRETFYNESGLVLYETSTNGDKNNNNTYRKLIGQELETLAPKKPIITSTKLF